MLIKREGVPYRMTITTKHMGTDRRKDNTQNYASTTLLVLMWQFLVVTWFCVTSIGKFGEEWIKEKRQCLWHTCDILRWKRRLNEEQCARWKQLKQQFWKMFVKLINGAYSTFFKSWEEKGKLNYKDTTCI